MPPCCFCWSYHAVFDTADQIILLRCLEAEVGIRIIAELVQIILVDQTQTVAVGDHLSVKDLSCRVSHCIILFHMFSDIFVKPSG